MRGNNGVVAAAGALTAAAGVANIVAPTAATGTGVGLTTIAAASIVNVLKDEKVIGRGLQKKLAKIVLAANLIPVAIGAGDIIHGEVPAGLSKLSLAGASVASCCGALRREKAISG